MEKSRICAFYQNENILISGGTGFMGTVLIEKLLRTTSVFKIYLLVRNRKDKTAKDRLLKLLKDSVFDEVRKTCPLYLDRVVAISGDLNSENLGLSQMDQETLKSNVTIAFHLAASTNFFEPLRTAYEFNIKGTERFINFCNNIKNLKSFVYVSTMYCNKFRETIDEVVYDDCISKTNLEKVLENFSDKELEAKRIIQHYLSSYCFSKAVTENFLMETENKFPIAIVRPPIVSAAYKEPLKYWMQHFDGFSLYLYFPACGITKILPIFPDYLDLMPVDLAVSALLATAWHITLRKTNEKIVYNCTSSVDVGITHHEAFHICAPDIWKNPPQQKILSNKFYLLDDNILTQCLIVFVHYLHAILVDFFAICTLKRPKVTQKVRMIHLILDLARQTFSKKKKISNANMKLMWQDMNEFDKKYFNFDPTTVEWLPYLRNLFDGIKIYLLKEHFTSKL